jgi:hypothetical protein
MNMGVTMQVIVFACLDLIAAASVDAQTSASSSAAQGAATVKNIEFDHLKATADRHYTRKLRDGEGITITIRNTCLSAFEYALRGIEREMPPVGVVAAAGEPLADKLIALVHDSRYGGYIVSITKTKEPQCANGTELQSRTLVIAVQDERWDVAFAGGFTLSNVRNPVFAIQADAAGARTIVEQTEKRDEAQLGVAAFIHTYHTSVPLFALSFGLGIRDNNKSEYFLGGGLRLSDKATLVTGIVFGPQDRLKGSDRSGAPPTDDNSLSDLPTKTARGFFVGVSYSFIDVQDRFKKPFAGAAGEKEAQKGAAAGTPRVGAGAAGCEIKITSTLTEFPAAGGEQKVQIDAGCQWTIRVSTATWATMTPAKGVAGASVVTIKADKNAAAEMRKTWFEIVPATGSPARVDIAQTGAGQD